ncbi:hypothetical protein [Priestia koreensis]|uniref:hypothetical protein n=1 Tax=Priestia koreensis TaxID=284581 RepID=UPI001F5AB342|nr:hypothetical protein [Priestia koreensis]UNL87509.1 hypothetical protein IE339_23670 [Priestia koreensis]
MTDKNNVYLITNTDQLDKPDIIAYDRTFVLKENQEVLEMIHIGRETITYDGDMKHFNELPKEVSLFKRVKVRQHQR